jgi:hypothetical protein
VKIDIALHLEHLLAADPADQPALLRRVAALAWGEGFNTAYEAGRDLGTQEFKNPYSAG